MTKIKFDIIVNECNSLGKCILTISCASLEDALIFGNTLRRACTKTPISILIRENATQTDTQGFFCREWQSLNGQSFQELRYNLAA